MQSIDISGMAEFSNKLNKLLDEAPGMRKKLHEEIAEMAKKEIDAHIANSGMDDSNSKVRNWQEKHVGSGGGYAAVRPTDESTGPNSPGAITRYLETGHNIRRPSGQSERYKPDINVPYVDGYHFYQNAYSKIENKAIKMAEDFADELVKMIGGD